MTFNKAREFNEGLVVYYPVLRIESKYGALRGEWGTEPQVLPLSMVSAIVGIWQREDSRNVYILRKHPGLDWLSPEERSLREEDLDNEEE